MADGAPIIIKKKKGHGGHAHHGGSWKVAYADFVTAMMAFFMVMWIMGLSDQTKAQVAGYFNDPFGMIKSEPNSKTIFTLPGVQSPHKGKETPNGMDAVVNDRDHLKQLAARLQHKISSDAGLKALLKNISIKITSEGLRIELIEATDAAFFETGSSTLTPEALQVVRSLSTLIAAAKRPYILEGHTDRRPYANNAFTNWDLSSDRANSLRRAMFSDGASPKELKGVRALADTMLEIPENPYDHRNRRVSILLPYQTDADKKNPLPKDQLLQDIQSAIHPPDISAASPKISPH